MFNRSCFAVVLLALVATGLALSRHPAVAVGLGQKDQEKAQKEAKEQGKDLKPPGKLVEIALTGTTQEQERATLELARFSRDDPRAAEATAGLRKVLEKSKSATVRAAALNGLGACKDWESILKVLDALEDDDEYVRKSAAVAYAQITGVIYGYDPRAATEERKGAISAMRVTGEAYHKMKLEEKKKKNGP